MKPLPLALGRSGSICSTILTRPHPAPSILLELGFMINPEEFEWITDEQEQQKLAKTLAEGIKEWFATVK